MCKIDEFGKCRHESWDVSRGMEQRWILFDKKVLHLPRAVLGCLVFCWTILGVLYLWLVVELFLFAGCWVHNWWEEGLWAMWHVEGKGLDMATYPRQRFNARRF